MRSLGWLRAMPATACLPAAVTSLPVPPMLGAVWHCCSRLHGIGNPTHSMTHVPDVFSFPIVRHQLKVCQLPSRLKTVRTARMLDVQCARTI